MEIIEKLNESFVKLESVLDEAKNDYSLDLEAFCKTKIFKMGRFIRLYSDFMKLLNIIVNDDVHEALALYNDKVKDKYFSERLNKFIAEWNEFLGIVEKNVN